MSRRLANPDSIIISDHFPELQQDIPFGNSIRNLAKSNTIEDRLEVPTHIEAGEYVVGFRWVRDQYLGTLSAQAFH